jgi:hypothetical protein
VETHQETTLNIDFGTNKERQDCKISTVWVVLKGGGEGMEERREYGWWVSYSYMK